MRLRDTELRQQERDAGGRHRGAEIRVDRQLPPRDAFATATRRDQPLGELCGFARREHPSDDIPTEHVEHDVEMQRTPRGRAFQCGDIPTPQRFEPVAKSSGAT